jgi:inosine/xanthosine triphosphate pyrophosphatase family protein
VTYATSSAFKQEEIAILAAQGQLDGRDLKDRVRFEFRDVEVKETLEVDLETMVRAEAASAYRSLLVPCIVEHAGLIFDDYAADGYPGGLTKPMWNTLGDRFVAETAAAERTASARAVVGYCDGQSVRTFCGETRGRIAPGPPRDRHFYWDTVFVPDDPDTGTAGTLTYAEIVAQQDLATKVLRHSQSTKAMLEFLRHRLGSAPRLWPAR